MPPPLRIGIDLGGSKIAGRLLWSNGHFGDEQRVRTPHGDYAATVRVIDDLVRALLEQADQDTTKQRHQGKATAARFAVGVGIPGSEAPSTGLIQNANSTWLNERAFARDLRQSLRAPVRLANDANCFALSEAVDGAAAGTPSAFGVILGTGCGGAYVHQGELIAGPRGNQGEWGHTPLPNPRVWPAGPAVAAHDERPGPRCWCGRSGCLETWLSGPAIAADYARNQDNLGSVASSLTSEQILDAADAGNPEACTIRERHLDRLARGLATVVNILDPAVIVLGGGLSARPHFYEQLPAAMAPHIFAHDRTIDVRPPKWGDASGVRGAARLWTLNELIDA